MSFSTAPIKAVADLNPETLGEDTPADAEYSYAEISDVAYGLPIQWQEPRPFEQLPSRARRLARDGDIVVSTVRTYLRAVARVEDSPDNAVASTGFAVLRPKAVESRYLGYALLSADFVEAVVAQSVGVSYPAINASDVARIHMPLPTPTEQRQIADYLDHETAEIDAFIADLTIGRAITTERFTAMRAAVMSEIDGATPQLRRFVEYVTSGSRGWSDLLGEEGDPFIRITNIARDSLAIQTSDLKRVNGVERTEGARARIEIGDVLMSITADLGSVGVAGTDVAGGYTSQHVALIRPSRALCEPRFLAHALLTPSTKAQIAEKSYGGTKIQLSLADVRELRVPLPSIEVQKRVAAEVDSAQESRDRQIADIDAAIALAKERRAALITAAVTGQIDVSGFGTRATRATQPAGVSATRATQPPGISGARATQPAGVSAARAIQPAGVSAVRATQPPGSDSIQTAIDESR
ncbi:restriction endonuclease subunit S [uncultured Microbacterium sp.]|uniref:restriction endonuclease subunit S n=1 Tax=uncultured Microbacterium sp. TaxID=191216 RepID=UPI00261E69C8|nr:restriction endonuclease subunit S [uncultured Microbacterium sp.]